VRVDTSGYSVAPRMIGWFVDVTASPNRVVVRCEGRVVAEHTRCWAKQAVITDPTHVELATQLRGDRNRAARHDGALVRQHCDGHPVALRALPDYDALFGVDFTPTPPPPSTASSTVNPPERTSADDNQRHNTAR
jgi:hypothetical protein